jgi:hypothetical protein
MMQETARARSHPTPSRSAREGGEAEQSRHHGENQEKQ